MLLQETLLPDDVPFLAQELAAARGGRVRVLLQHAARGFTANLTEAEAIRLSQDPRVLLVEENSQVHLSSEQILPADNSLWALDRIDQRTSIIGGDDRYRYCEKASGVIAYVLDTGINKNHQEFLSGFSSRVINGVKFANDHHIWPGEGDDYGTFPCGAWTNNYNAGHGTSVASIIGGKTVGAAKSVQLVPLRVFECTEFSVRLATVEHLCWALDWIKSPSNPNRNNRPALVNISLRIAVITPPENPDLVGSLESVINGLVLDSPGWTGITVVASANNQGSNLACSTPARMAYRNTGFVSPGRVISVGATNESDTRWTSGNQGDPEYYEEQAPCGAAGQMVPAASNYGPIVDIYAPGHNIASAHIFCSTCRRTVANSKSGTSFSAAVVSGIVARMLQANPGLSPTGVWNQLQTDATHLGLDIDPDPFVFNDMIAYRAGSVSCSPQYP